MKDRLHTMQNKRTRRARSRDRESGYRVLLRKVGDHKVKERRECGYRIHI